MNQNLSTKRPDFISYLDPHLADVDVHDTFKAPISAAEITMSLLLALVLGVVSLWLTSAVVGGSVSAVTALAIHLLVCGIGFIINHFRAKTGLDTRASSVALILLTFTGFCGAFGVVVMVLSHVLFRQETLSFSEWINFIYPRPTPTLGEKVFDDIDLKIDAHPRSYDVLPFMDVMRLGSMEQKREAINQVMLHFHPRLTPVLHAALKDSSLSVRTLAATSMVRLEKQLQERERKLEKLLTHEEQTVDLLLVAARFYDDYAFSGLVDSDRKQRYVKQAYDYYQRYLRRRSTDAQAAAWVGRLLIRSGQLEKAAAWLKQLIDEGRGDGHILSWYLEVLFNLQRFAELRLFVRSYAGKLEQLLHDELHYAPLAQALQLWLKNNKESRA